MKVLAGDIGGTKTLLRIAEVADDEQQVLFEERYASAEYPGLVPMVREFLNKAPSSVTVEAACFGVAGPVRGDRAQVTNLPWDLDAQSMAGSLKVSRVKLINDFQAIGYGLSVLQPEDFMVLQDNRERPRAPRALIGAGTGLGQALLVWHGWRYEVIPTEGGHADFAPVDEEQIALLRFLMARWQHVSYERLLSGPGLVNIYEFLRSTSTAAEEPALVEDGKAEDPAAAISEAALDGSDPLAVRALDLFVRIYGQQAGNLALTCLARGGVYIAGGIAPRIVAKLKSPVFIEAFRAKGRMSRLVEEMSVKVVLNSKVGLMGAARAAGWI